MSSLDRILPFLKPIEDLLCDPTVTEVMFASSARRSSMTCCTPPARSVSGVRFFHQPARDHIVSTRSETTPRSASAINSSTRLR